MKISKSIWIGLAICILWGVGVVLGIEQCNWNPVCNGASKGGFWCMVGGWIFYSPALIGESIFEHIFQWVGFLSHG